MKTISIVTKTIANEIPADGAHCTKVIAWDQKEDWQLQISTSDKGEDRELSQIKITMPDGKIWKGTIQCFMSIFQIADNALKILKEDQQIGFTDAEDQEEIDQCVIEIENLLSHLSIS